MFKRRDFLKCAGAALSAVTFQLLVPGKAEAWAPEARSHLDLNTAIRQWSKKSEYSTKRLTGYGAFYGRPTYCSTTASY